MAPAATTRPPLRKGTNASGYGEVILRNGRILLGVVAVIVLGQIWNISLEAMASRGLGTRIAESLFDIVITLILASAGWGILKTAINRQLPYETLDALAMADGEVSGTGLSRLETLLPLLRKFLFVAMIVVVAMIVISSLGINIGPLLAGAGVVGIAVGFGAQTLVRDILSGIFFLVDDAFRIGEYIDVGEGKGTVERMSIRALMLRHHLGQINTIPFGVIRRVTNYSRDWAIMKLELRVPFDTDLEKVRKIVKQVGQEMLADPEYGAELPPAAEVAGRAPHGRLVVDRPREVHGQTGRAVPAAARSVPSRPGSFSPERHQIRAAPGHRRHSRDAWCRCCGGRRRGNRGRGREQQAPWRKGLSGLHRILIETWIVPTPLPRQRLRYFP